MARARVLVIEDDESYQELYQTFFARLHAVEFIGVLAKSGNGAFAHLGKHPSPPIDAAILDWRLPDTEGLTILRHIRSNPATRNIVVFMVTGNTRDGDTEAALQARADDYIIKPYSFQELLNKINEKIRIKKERSELK
jgi:DNA-binding response OmpR family regulator